MGGANLLFPNISPTRLASRLATSTAAAFTGFAEEVQELRGREHGVHLARCARVAFASAGRKAILTH